MCDFFYFGWGTWDRTKECRSQRPMPYRLAIPQFIHLFVLQRRLELLPGE